MSDPPPTPTRLQRIVSELLKAEALINSGKRCSIHIESYPDELKVEVTQHQSVKLSDAA